MAEPFAPTNRPRRAGPDVSADVLERGFDPYATASVVEFDPEPDEMQEVDDLPTIEDLNALARAFRHLVAARSYIREIEQTAQRERDRIDEWEHRATERKRRRVARIEQQIGLYARSRREQSNERDKSLTTPWGIVSTTAQEDEYVRDDAVLLAWAAERGYTRQRVTHELDWKRLKADLMPHMGGACLLDSEVVPGVVHRAREPKVTVTPWE